jgi:hypothetical protein
MSKVHLARSGFITKAALPSITRQRGTTTGASNLMLFGAGKTTVANNTTFIDSSTNAFTVTRNGDTVHSGYNPFGTVSDGSAYFDGNLDYLSIPANAGFNFGTGDFTIESYVYIAGNSPLDGISRRYALIFGVASGGSVSFELLIAGNSSTTGTGIELYNGSTVVGVTGTVSQSTWHHIAVSRSGSSFYFFLNGVQLGTTQTSSISFGSSTQTAVVGKDPSTSAFDFDFNGYISNLRVVKGTALYTANFTPPTSALTAITNTQLLLLTDNYSIVNSTPTPLPVTINGNTTISTAQYPTGMDRSIYFDGTGDYLTPAVSSEYSFGTGDFTIECYAYFSSVSNNGLFQLYSSSFPSQTYGICAGAANLYGGWFLCYGSTSVIISTTAATANTWVHLAVVRASGVIKLYINGTSIISASDSTNYTYTYLNIGGYYSTSFLMNGYVSNFRLAKGTAVYTANFTAPSAPLSINISVPAFVTNAIYGVNQLA